MFDATEEELFGGDFPSTSPSPTDFGGSTDTMWILGRHADNKLYLYQIAKSTIEYFYTYHSAYGPFRLVARFQEHANRGEHVLAEGDSQETVDDLLTHLFEAIQNGDETISLI